MFLLVLLALQIQTSSEDIVGEYSTKNNSGFDCKLVLKSDSTFEKHEPGAWDSTTKRKWIIKSNWTIKNEKLILNWKKPFTKQQTKEYFIKILDDRTFLIPIDGLNRFEELIRSNPEGNQEILIKKETLNTYLQKERSK